METVDRLIRNAVNIPGWSTKRKIVIIESDDWGSIRMSSKQNRDNLIKNGFSFDGQHYNMFDQLESNDDLTALFEVLCKYKDATNRNPVITAVSIVGNPDFKKIEKYNFQKYYFEPFTDTLKQYPNHNKVIELYKQGLYERVFYPVFHGREHLNVQRWMKALQAGNESVLKTFSYNTTGIHLGINNQFLGDFQAAYDLDSPEDIKYLETVLKEGLDLFENIWNYKSDYFVPTNRPFNNSLEKTLFEKGVKYILSERVQKEPLGNMKYKTHLRFIGMKNKFNQTYLTRNVQFEPSSFEYNFNYQPVEKCLRDVERAFLWGKPATIITHRVNYIGGIDENNRSRNLKLLSNLISRIILKWPEVEFMTSPELGNLINTK